MKKKYDKIRHPLIIKTLNKIGIEGKYLNMIKIQYDKTRMPTLTTLLQHIAGSPSQS